ncbi:MAG: group I intron-associated PD-(D/E)XK endonuclease, partial [Rubricoccaceae bacterium]|nr:group I intron-associated PD-(D/E)XK endonuclease [Rubricoccaceae bacterium]
AADFDFALVYVEDYDVFYVFPVQVFTSYGSGIHLVEAERRQRKPRSADYRGAWHLIQEWAVRGETPVRTPVKLGEAAGGVIPSQALRELREGVET